MKRMLWMLAALLLAGCEKSPIEEQSAIAEEEFYATFENDSDSRTFLDEQLRLRWTADDRITIFKKSAYNREFAFTGVTGSNAGGFRQVSVDDEFWYGATLSYNYAAYPHSNTTTFHEDGYFTLTMPAEQSYAENSVGLGANTMVAMSESGQLVFKNVGSFLRVQLYGADQSVKKITLSSNAGEALAGEAKVCPSLTEDPTCTMVGTTSSIVLTCAEAVTVNATEDAPVSFWIVVPPCTLSEGYKVTVENADGETQEFFVNKEKTFTRNVYSTLKRELTIGVVPSNQVWYTATEKIEKSSWTKDTFGANIVSNEWNETTSEGVIYFDGEVTTIGRDAFYGCSSITSTTIPNSVTAIGLCAFRNCTSLMEFNSELASSDKRCLIIDGVLCGFAQAELTQYAIPEGVTTIGENVFSYCHSLTSITLPNSVTMIQSDAFKSCSSLTSMTIPESVTRIGDRAFFGCSSLTFATVPNSVTEIGYLTFGRCPSLMEFDSELASSDKRCLIIDGALCGFAPAGLTSYSIPEGVTTIEDGALSDCASLTSLVIPKGVTTIGKTAFLGCSGLTSVIILEGVTTIGSNAFNGCSSLVSVPIPNSVTMIGNDAFRDCSSLIEFDSELASNDKRCLIINGALYGFAQAGLTTYSIPEGVTTIKNSVFHGCSLLTSVIIPDGVTTIEIYAFFGCSSLTSVYCKATIPPTLGSGVFNGNASDRKIYVPASEDDSIINAYKAATGWSEYADAIVEYDFSAEQ